MLANTSRSFLQFFKLLPIIIFLMTGVVFNAGAQSYYHAKKIDLPAPFKYSEIKDITQDKEGFIWFINSQGIWRFDGTTVQPFNSHYADLPQSAVPDYIYAHDDYLLIFFEEDAKSLLFTYNTKTLQLIKYEIDTPPAGFYKTPKGELEFYGRRGQKWFFAHQMVIKEKKDPNIVHWLGKETLQNFKVDADGSVYLCYNEKIARLKDGHFFAGPGDTVKVQGNPSFKFTQSKAILVSSKYILDKFGNGFIIFDKKTLQQVYVYKGDGIAMICLLHDEFILLQDEAGSLQADSRFFKIQQSPFVGQADIVKNIAPEIHSDKLLVATNRGIFELIADAGNSYNNKQNAATGGFFKKKSVRSIYRMANGKLYVGVYGGFFAVDTTGSIHEVSTNVVYCISRIDDHSLLLGIEGGVGFATLNTDTDQMTFLSNPSQRTYGFSLAKDGDSFLAGTAFVMYRISKQANQQWQLQKLFRKDSLGFVKQIKKINNQWWIASANGLFRLENDTVLKRIYPQTGRMTIYSMLPEKDGVWLGTAANGLVKINFGGKVLNQVRFSNGLAGEFVYSLYNANGLIFAGTNGGLSVFDTHAGMLVISPPDYEEYSQELNHSAIFYDETRHQLIMGGVGGLLFIDMEHYSLAKSKEADMVKLSYFKKGSNGVLPGETNLFAYQQPGITLYPGDVFMGLKFAGNNIWHQGKFLFRLRELDSTWRKADLADEISFYSLSPGKYTLQARFASAVNSRYWLSKTIIVVPHFYQTWYFDVVVIAIIGLLIYAAWLARLDQIRKEQLVRTTIASDLHDEIGSALTRISMSSELMHIRQSADAKVIEHISDDSKNAIASISDIIWSIDARNDNKEDLLLRMRQHAFVMLEDNAEVHFEATGLDKVVDLPQLIRQNVYLIFKEAINNILKHNHHPEVWIELKNRTSGMTITIKNTINAQTKTSNYTGQGLKNMKMRAERIKGSVNIVTGGDLFLVIIKMKKW